MSAQTFGQLKRVLNIKWWKRPQDQHLYMMACVFNKFIPANIRQQPKMKQVFLELFYAPVSDISRIPLIYVMKVCTHELYYGMFPL